MVDGGGWVVTYEALGLHLIASGAFGLFCAFLWLLWQDNKRPPGPKALRGSVRPSQGPGGSTGPSGPLKAETAHRGPQGPQREEETK